jgi:hypothetical protein
VEWWYFWWLIFPIGGSIAAALKRRAAASERRERRAHERELALIRAGQIAPAPAAPTATPDSATGQTSVERLLAAHDDVTRRWLEYELDVGKLIAYPAMSDGRQPLTAAFLRAKKVADRLRPASAQAPLDPTQLREYREAVTDYEVAFEVAERDARRLKDSAFSDAERKRLDTAQRLLRVAVDEAATPAERQIAYRRVREELDGLLSLSDEAVDVLEKRVSLELPAGRSATPDAAAQVAPAPADPSPPAADAPAAPRPPAPPAGPRDTTPPGRVIRPKPGT